MVNVFKEVDNRSPSESSPLLKAKAELKPFWKKPWFTFLIIIFVMAVLIAVISVYLTASKSSSPNATDHASLSFGHKSRPILRIQSVATTNGDYFEKCSPPVTCDPNEKYRTYNGSCNNLQNPNWGAAMTPFYRLMNAEFSDNNYTFRVQSDGKPLPSARLVGLKLFYMREKRDNDHKNNELLVPWGQFVTHDVSYYPDDVRNKTTPTNLDHCFEKDKSKIPFECTTIITIPKNDPVYGPYNVSLFKFVRSMTSVNFSCPLTPRTILNRNTQYIDASHVYGSDLNTADGLRSFENGKLRSRILKNEEYCPQDQNSQFANGVFGKSKVQFAAGDPNVNQNLAIALFQNLFLRYHNHLADKLHKINPSWSDEKIYQETRRIVGAVIQVITYEHFLPIILGKENIKQYGLIEPTIYDPSINSAFAQEMTSGAFRVLHNIIPAKFNFMAANYSIIGEIEPSKVLDKPDMLVGNVDSMLRGFLETRGRAVQPSYNSLITSTLFKIPNLSSYSGFDLMSYDIQRGRDNGLPPYNKMRRVCGLAKATKFADLSDFISQKDIETLKTLYSTVHDIDYLVGALLEKPKVGSMVGPSAACVIGDSFYRLKFGDRFFYDVQRQPGSFTPEQIEFLKNITLSHIICLSSNLDHLQKSTFRYVDHKWMSAIKFSCESYITDLSAWKEY